MKEQQRHGSRPYPPVGWQSESDNTTATCVQVDGKGVAVIGDHGIEEGNDGDGEELICECTEEQAVQ
jgi:hypothetical protein